jgi:transposase
MRVRREVTVRLALEPVDFRKSIDGLAMAVGNSLGRDPMCGELFLFHNKNRTALKALYWTPNGFVLVYKRLERLRFQVPERPASGADIVLEPGLLQELLDGLTRVVGNRNKLGNTS